MTDALPDTLREALGQVIANERREWRRERELIEAQSREAIADLRARIVELERGIEQRVADRLASLKDGAPGASVTADDVAPIIQAEVQRAIAAAELPKDGKDADPDLIAAAVEQAVAAAISALPPAEKGQDADPVEIARMVSEAVREIPVPAPGKDADPEMVRQVVLEAVSALPAAERGEQGPAGKLPVVKGWTDRVHYEGEVVTCEGSTFQALRDTGRETSHGDWLLLAAAGRNGEDGRSFNVCGTWTEANEYNALDVVALGGGSFIARRDNPGPCPGEGWQLIASQGKRGNAGERGAPGPKGDRGPAGAALISAEVDDEGLLTLTNGDGSSIECDLYPLLSKLGR